MKRLYLILGIVLTAATALAAGESNITIAEAFPGPTSETMPAFVELYNGSGSNVALSGWQLKIYTANGLERVVFPSSAVIPARGFFLVGVAADRDAWASESVKPDIYLALASSLSRTRGAVILAQVNNTVADTAGWGDVPSPYFEGTACTAPGVGSSLERKSGASHDESRGNSYDTDNNRNDFRLRPTPQPQNTSSPREYPAANTEDHAWGRIKAMYYGRR
jgi:hypothetical protein